MTRLDFQGAERAGAAGPARGGSSNGEATVSSRAARLTRCFGNRRPVALTAIQVRDERQAHIRVETAWTRGAGGVFLAGHTIGHQRLLRIARRIATQNPHRFIGLHCPDLRSQDILCRLPPGINGIWTDSRGLWPPNIETIAAIRRARLESRWDGLHLVEINLAHLKALPAVSDAQYPAGSPTGALDVDVAILGGLWPPGPGADSEVERSFAPAPAAPQAGVPAAPSAPADPARPASTGARLALEPLLAALGEPPLAVIGLEMTESLTRLGRTASCIVTWES